MITKNARINQKVPKNPGMSQKGTQNSGITPRKVPKIMAHHRITTYPSPLHLELQVWQKHFGISK